MLKTGGASVPMVAGLGRLSRISWMRVEPNGEFGGNADIVSSMSGPPVSLATSWTVTGVAIARTGTGQQIDGWPAWGVRPTLLDGCTAQFRAATGTLSPFPHAGFRDSFLASGMTLADGSSEPLESSYASVMQAWLRLHELGGVPSARLFFGWANTRSFTNGALRQMSRVGLIGDGVTGLRFGSVNCPDGFNAGQNGLTDIDANAVTIAELVNPGAAWMHIRVKLIPPTPFSDTGVVACYLNGNLVAQFTQLTNFPRAAQGLAGANNQWGRIEPVVMAGFDAVTQLAGWRMRRFEAWYDLDLSV